MSWVVVSALGSLFSGVSTIIYAVLTLLSTWIAWQACKYGREYAHRIQVLEDARESDRTAWDNQRETWIGHAAAWADQREEWEADRKRWEQDRKRREREAEEQWNIWQRQSKNWASANQTVNDKDHIINGLRKEKSEWETQRQNFVDRQIADAAEIDQLKERLRTGETCGGDSGIGARSSVGPLVVSSERNDEPKPQRKPGGSFTTQLGPGEVKKRAKTNSD